MTLASKSTVWASRQHHDWQREAYAAGYYAPGAAPLGDRVKAVPLSNATGGYLFTMEFIDGRDVLSETDSGDLETVLDLMVGICRALAYVHGRGVIYFDLKPSNVLRPSPGLSGARTSAPATIG